MLAGGGIAVLGAKMMVLAALASCPASSFAQHVNVDAVPQPAVTEPYGAPAGKIATASTKLTARAEFVFHKLPIAGTDQTCLYIKDINVHLLVIPVIHMNPQYRPGSCEYDTVQKLFENYTPRLQLDENGYKAMFSGPLLKELAALSLTRPLTPTELVDADKALRSRLTAIIDVQLKNMTDAIKSDKTQLRYDFDTTRISCK